MLYLQWFLGSCSRVRLPTSRRAPRPAGVPPLPSDQVLQGTSLGPVLASPPRSGTGPKPFAFSQFAKSMTHSEELGKPMPWGVRMLGHAHATRELRSWAP